MRTPTSLLLDKPPVWSILAAARPVTDLPGVSTQQDWVGGLNLWHVTTSGERWRHPSGLDGSDPDIAAIADPSVWTTELDVQEAGQTVYLLPNGAKLHRGDPAITGFRAFTVYTPIVSIDADGQTDPSAAEQARTELEAHAAGQVMAEFADSLFTKNPGLYRTATDVSNASAVDANVAISTLYEAHGAAGGSGHVALTVPWHAVPFLMDRRLARWSRDQLVDCYGNPIITAPGYVGRGPITDPADLETSQAPGAGEGYFYLSEVPFVGLGESRARVAAPEGARPGWTRGNEEVNVAEAPAIVAFRPDRVHACLTSLNEVL